MARPSPPGGRVVRPERDGTQRPWITQPRRDGCTTLINAGDIGGFSEHLADNFVEHEVTPGLEPTKDGVKNFFRMQLAAFPDLHMHVQDVFASGAKVVARVRYTGTNRGASWACRPPARASTCS